MSANRLAAFLARFTGRTAVRAATPRDKADCAALAVRYYQGAGYTLGMDSVTRIFERIGELLEDESSTLLLAERGGQGIGLVVCERAGVDLVSGDDAMTVLCLYVRPEYRASPEVVMSLLRAVYNMVISANISRVYLSVDADMRPLTRHYQKSLGFRLEKANDLYVLDMKG